MLRGCSIECVIGWLLGLQDSISHEKGASRRVVTPDVLCVERHRRSAGSHWDRGRVYAEESRSEELHVWAGGGGTSEQGRVVEPVLWPKLRNLPTIFVFKNNKNGRGASDGLLSTVSPVPSIYPRGQVSWLPGYRHGHNSHHPSRRVHQQMGRRHDKGLLLEFLTYKVERIRSLFSFFVDFHVFWVVRSFSTRQQLVDLRIGWRGFVVAAWVFGFPRVFTVLVLNILGLSTAFFAGLSALFCWIPSRVCRVPAVFCYPHPRRTISMVVNRVPSDFRYSVPPPPAISVLFVLSCCDPFHPHTSSSCQPWEEERAGVL